MEREHKITVEFADGRALAISTGQQVKISIEPHMESAMTTVFEDNGRSHALTFPTIEGLHVTIECDVPKGKLIQNFAENFPISPIDKQRFVEAIDENIRPAEVP